MSKRQFILLALISICTMSSCSKDDLCIPEELDVPRLIIVFVDARNQLLRKPVDQLQVIESTTNEAIPLNSEGVLALTQVDSIAIPLPIDQNGTIYGFVRTLNQVQNSDQFSLNYQQDEVYLNRACGFKAVFTDLSSSRIAEPAGENWISTVIIREPDVTSNRDIHVEIRH